MFGGSHPDKGGMGAQQRVSAGELARIEGGGLVQVIVTNTAPLTYSLFLNDREVSQMEIESLSVYIAAPDQSGSVGMVRATLARYVQNVAGERSLQRTELFPCTLELIALGRRIAITCMNADSFDGLWVYLGLKPNGDSNELGGLKSVTILLSAELFSASLTWEDGETEDLLPR